MLIGIYSPFPQSGKSTVREMLINIDKKHGYFNFSHGSFAAKVKESLFLIFQDADFDITPYLYGDKKSETIPGISLTGGQLMSRYAMWWREHDEDVWVRLFWDNYSDQNFIVDDLRFPNERAIMNYTILVTNNRVKGHNRSTSSEGNLDNYHFDYVIKNNGSFEELRKNVEAVYDFLRLANVYRGETT